MKKDIWNRDSWWDVNEYNQRLSKENKTLQKYDKLIKELEDKEELEIKEIWGQKVFPTSTHITP